MSPPRPSTESPRRSGPLPPKLTGSEHCAACAGVAARDLGRLRGPRAPLAGQISSSIRGAPGLARHGDPGTGPARAREPEGDLDAAPRDPLAAANSQSVNMRTFTGRRGRKGACTLLRTGSWVDVHVGERTDIASKRRPRRRHGPRRLQGPPWPASKFGGTSQLQATGALPELIEFVDILPFLHGPCESINCTISDRYRSC